MKIWIDKEKNIYTDLSSVLNTIPLVLWIRWKAWWYGLEYEELVKGRIVYK